MNTTFPKLLLGAAIFCSMLLLMDCTSVSQEGTRHAQAMRGKEIFAEQCMPCHGMDDLPPTKTDLQEKAPDLTQIMKRRKKSEFPVAEIARV